MARPLGMTTTAILAALRQGARYGLDITQRSGLLPGTVYTTLRRLENRDFIRGQWEDPAIAEAERRPRRRYYQLTRDGERALEAATANLAALSADSPGGIRAQGRVRGEAES